MTSLRGSGFVEVTRVGTVSSVVIECPCGVRETETQTSAAAVALSLVGTVARCQLGSVSITLHASSVPGEQLGCMCVSQALMFK